MPYMQSGGYLIVFGCAQLHLNTLFFLYTTILGYEIL